MSTAFLCGTKLCSYDLKKKKETTNVKMHLTGQCCSGGNNDRQVLTWIAWGQACKENGVQFTHMKEARMYHRRKSFSENVNGNFKKALQCLEIKEEVKKLLETPVQPRSYVPKLF